MFRSCHHQAWEVRYAFMFEKRFCETRRKDKALFLKYQQCQLQYYTSLARHCLQFNQFDKTDRSDGSYFPAVRLAAGLVPFALIFNSNR